MSISLQKRGCYCSPARRSVGRPAYPSAFRSIRSNATRNTRTRSCGDNGGPTSTPGRHRRNPAHVAPPARPASSPAPRPRRCGPHRVRARQGRPPSQASAPNCTAPTTDQHRGFAIRSASDATFCRSARSCSNSTRAYSPTATGRPSTLISCEVPTTPPRCARGAASTRRLPRADVPGPLPLPQDGLVRAGARPS